MEDIIKILSGAGTVGVVWGGLTYLGKKGYIRGRVTIGNDTNGNGEKKEDKVEVLEQHLATLTEVANHNFSDLKERFREHTDDDKEFFREQRGFNERLWQQIILRSKNENL